MSDLEWWQEELESEAQADIKRPVGRPRSHGLSRYTRGGCRCEVCTRAYQHRNDFVKNWRKPFLKIKPTRRNR